MDDHKPHTERHHLDLFNDHDPALAAQKQAEFAVLFPRTGKQRRKGELDEVSPELEAARRAYFGLPEKKD